MDAGHARMPAQAEARRVAHTWRRRLLQCGGHLGGGAAGSTCAARMLTTKSWSIHSAALSSKRAFSRAPRAFSSIGHVLSMRMRPWGRSKPSLLFTLLCRRDFCAGRKQPSKTLKFGGSKGTVSSLVERRRRERQARSDALSLWVAYLPQRSSSVALRALFFVRSCGLTTPHTAQPCC